MTTTAPQPETETTTDLELVADNTPAEVEHPEMRMMRQAHTLATSNIVPKQYIGKPDDIVAAGLMGRSYGLDLMQSLRSIHVVDGKPTMAAEAMLAMVRKRGHSVTGKKSRTTVTITGVRADNGDTMEIEWTLDDARDAKLLNKNNWKSYPRQMLWARAVSELCTSLFSDITNGLYVWEELQDAEVEVLETKPDKILDTTTGELVDMTQPKPGQAIIDEILDTFDKLPDEAQAAASEWLATFTNDDGTFARLTFTEESVAEWHPATADTVLNALRSKLAKLSTEANAEPPEPTDLDELYEDLDES